MAAITILIQERVQRTPDNHFWIGSPSNYQYYKKFLAVYSKVFIIARTYEVSRQNEFLTLLDGEGVEIVPLANITGMAHVVSHLYSYIRDLDYIFNKTTAVILRVPFFLSDLSVQILNKKKIPFAVDVIGDSWDALSPASKVGGILRPIIRYTCYWSQKRSCRLAICAKYVTNHALQVRYPSQGPKWAASDVLLSKDAYVSEIRPYRKASPIKLISVGTLDTLYKAHDIQIHSIRLLKEMGYDVTLTIVGDGKFKPDMESMVEKMDLGGSVFFKGRLTSGQAIRAELDKADIFIMPSLAEGMPRALLEAMARGMPCIGTTIGGIVELLPRPDLVPPRDSQALANKIVDFAENESRWNQSALQNLQVSRAYEEKLLEVKLLEFLEYLRYNTESQ